MTEKKCCMYGISMQSAYCGIIFKYFNRLLSTVAVVSSMF